MKEDKINNQENELYVEFINLAGDMINDFGPDHLEQALENFDSIQFDVFNYQTYLMEKASLPFIVHKIFHTYEFIQTYDIEPQVCFNFSKEVSNRKFVFYSIVFI